ncbi:MAG TPA: hypothetical protein VIV11_05595 [Kofleriaceae bacterium]
MVLCGAYRCSFALIAVLIGAGCDSVFGLQHVRPIDAPPISIDAPPPLPFNTAVAIEELNTGGMEEDDPSLTGDLTELYFLRSSDIWMSLRGSATAPWGIPGLVSQLNTATTELRPSVAADGLTLYFSRGVLGNRDVYVSTRAARGQPWGVPTLLALDLNRPSTDEHVGWSSPDGLTLIVESQTAAGANPDLYLATRPAIGAPFTSEPIAALNSQADETGGWATADGERVVFSSNRFGDYAIFEAIWFDGGWSVFHHPELDTAGPESTPWLSPDGNTIVFARSLPRDDLFTANR